MQALPATGGAPGRRNMIGFRLHVNHGGGHCHFGVYAGSVPEGNEPAHTTYGFCGVMSMQQQEYAAFTRALRESGSIHFEEIATTVAAP